MSAAAVEIGAPRDSVLRRFSDVLTRRHGFYLLLLLIPPLLWLGIVYLGSLFALLAESFFSIDDFSGVIVRQPTLKTYGELFRPANFDIIVRTVSIATVVTLLAVLVAFPIAYYAARYARGRMKAAFGFRADFFFAGFFFAGLAAFFFFVAALAIDTPFKRVKPVTRMVARSYCTFASQIAFSHGTARLKPSACPLVW